MKLYIAVADGDVLTHKLVRRAAKSCNKNTIVTSVYNGTQLLDLLYQRGFYRLEISRLPDVVILDVSMPVMNGFSVLEEMQSNSQLKMIPVFALCNTRNESKIERALSLGADSVFTKPLDPDQIKQVLLGFCAKAGKMTGS